MDHTVMVLALARWIRLVQAEVIYVICSLVSRLFQPLGRVKRSTSVCWIHEYCRSYWIPNRRHQQSVVSAREQQESDVLKKAYTRSREQQKNRLMHISK